MEQTKYPRSFNHIGITVPDIEKAFYFYTHVLGWYPMAKPALVFEDKSTPEGQMCIDVFGEGFKQFKVAHVSSSNGIGMEIFEFPLSTKENYQYQPFKTSVFHICVQDPDIEGLAKKIVENGGKQRMPIRYFDPNKPFRMVYMEDPFGNILEIVTHSYDAIHGGSIK